MLKPDCPSCEAPIEGCDCPRCVRCKELTHECICSCGGCLQAICDCEA